VNQFRNATSSRNSQRDQVEFEPDRELKDTEMIKRLKPVYFENQKQCATALGLDVRELREWKAENCPAFRYGRIYHADLLDWIEKRKNEHSSAAEAGSSELPKSHWDRQKARVDYERALFLLELEKHKHVELDEICAAVGQMLAGFRTAINMLPSSAARWLIGLKDFHAIKSKLQSEVDAVLHSLGRCRYLEDLAPGVIDRLLENRPKEYRDDVQKSVSQVFIELGRECFRELQIDLGESPTEPPSMSHAAPDSESFPG
jgi:hypothetical protein